MKNRQSIVNMRVLTGLATLACGAGSVLADASAMNLLFPFNSANPAGWTQTMARNDDGSSAQIQLGFDFCFYEEDRSSLYVNNNGNVSFNSPYSSFTSTGFPVSGFDMIAPFWADVDTRNPTGADTNLVWHKTTAGNAGGQVFVVTWDAVGWYSGQNGQTNTFQLALSSDENEWGTGLNAAFSYGNMAWTTGQASGGGPYGGTAATVGINRGNGVDFDQLGRFDHAGTDYAGGGANPGTSGVQWLNNSTRYFDACQGIVPAPGALAVLGLGGLMAARRRR